MQGHVGQWIVEDGTVLISPKVSIQAIPDTSEEKSIVEFGTGGHQGITTVIGTHGRVALFKTGMSSEICHSWVHYSMASIPRIPSLYYY